MKYTVQVFADKFRTIVGDESMNIPDNLIIEAINWAFTEIPTVQKLDKVFSRHYRVNLNSRYGVKWKLNKDFRRLTRTPLLSFYSTAEGGDPCPLKLCGYEPVKFYEQYGIPELKKAGVPCAYTIEQEGDDIYLVIDRPADCPLVLDYIAYGYPKPVTSMEDRIEISAPLERLLMTLMRKVLYSEAEDLAFAGAMEDLLSNKYEPEIQQLLNQMWSTLEPTILGER